MNWTEVDLARLKLYPEPRPGEFVTVREIKPKVPKPWAPYRSKVEARFAQHLDLMVKAGAIDSWQYEPVSLRLAPGVSYLPDFVTWVNGFPAFLECKGRKAESYWTLPVSRIKIRLAAKLFPHWRFYVTWPGKREGEWERVLIAKE